MQVSQDNLPVPYCSLLQPTCADVYQTVHRMVSHLPHDDLLSLIVGAEYKQKESGLLQLITYMNIT